MVLDGATYMNNDPQTNGRRLLVRYNSGKDDVRTHMYYCVNNDTQHGFKITNQNSGDFTIVFGKPDYDYQFMIDKRNLIFPANMLYNVYDEDDGWDVRDTSCDLYLTDYEIMAVYSKEASSSVRSSIVLYTNSTLGEDANEINIDSYKADLKSFVSTLYGSYIELDRNSDMNGIDVTAYNRLILSYTVGERVMTVSYRLTYLTQISVFFPISIKEVMVLKYCNGTFSTKSEVNINKQVNPQNPEFVYYATNHVISLDVTVDIANYTLTYCNYYYNHVSTTTPQTLNCILLANEA